MAEQKTIICAQCGKELQIDSNMEAGFCLHCGMRFAAVSQPQEEAPLSAHAAALFADKNWTALEGYARGALDASIALLGYCAAFHRRIDRYLEDAVELARSTGARNILQSLLGRDIYGDSPIHKEFYDDIERQISVLADRLAAHDALLDTVEMIAESVAQRLLYEQIEKNRPMYWSLLAIQQFSIPILPCLSKSTLETIYADYCKTYPRNQSLPNQMKVKSEMARLIVEKGGQPPTKRRLG